MRLSADIEPLTVRPSGVVNDAPMRVPDAAVTTTGAIGDTPVAAAAGTVLIAGPGSADGTADVVVAAAVVGVAADPFAEGDSGGSDNEGSDNGDSGTDATGAGGMEDAGSVDTGVGEDATGVD